MASYGDENDNSDVEMFDGPDDDIAAADINDTIAGINADASIHNGANNGTSAESSADVAEEAMSDARSEVSDENIMPGTSDDNPTGQGNSSDAESDDVGILI
jgi:hypothetical protein